MLDDATQALTDNVLSVTQIMANWEQGILHYLPSLFLGILVWFIFFVIAKFARQLSLKFYQKTIKTHGDIAQILSSLIYVFFLISGTFLSLQILGLEQVLTKLLAGAGIVGIIAGFAFKDIASNIFAGLLLKIQQPFKSQDWVQINDVYGVITQVSWISTNITTITGQEVFIPNQLIYNNSLTNFSTYQKRRVVLESGVSYGDDLEKVRQVSLDEVKKLPLLLAEESVDFYFTKIDSSTYNFQIRFWIKFNCDDDYMQAMSTIIVAIKKRFEHENISIAYSVMSLDFGVKGGVNLFDKPIELHS